MHFSQPPKEVKQCPGFPVLAYPEKSLAALINLIHDIPVSMTFMPLYTDGVTHVLFELGGRARHWIRTRSLHGETGSAGAP